MVDKRLYHSLSFHFKQVFFVVFSKPVSLTETWEHEQYLTANGTGWRINIKSMKCSTSLQSLKLFERSAINSGVEMKNRNPALYFIDHLLKIPFSLTWFEMLTSSRLNCHVLRSILDSGDSLQYSCLKKIPWTEEPGGLQAMGSQRVTHNWVHTQCNPRSIVDPPLFD